MVSLANNTAHQPYAIRPYETAHQQETLAFLSSVFAESGKVFDICGRHCMYADITHNFERFWLLFDGRAIIGTAAVRAHKGTVCELKALYILQKYYGQKLGYALLQTAIAFAQSRRFTSLLLDTVSSSTRALKLYEKMGFRRIPRYNDNPYADIFMELNLTELQSQAGET